MIRDSLAPLQSGESKIEGYLGKRIEDCITNGIMSTDYSLFVAPFKVKTDDNGDWGGEFFGKWYTSAALAYRYDPREEYLQIINDAIDGLKDTQAENGRLSASNIDFSNWDLWGRKYSLLALLSHYEQTQDRSSLDAATRSVDNLMEIVGKGKKKITETGLKVVESLSSNSILEPIVLLYQYTKEDKYLEFAEHIVSLWSEANSYTAEGMKLVEDALDNKAPIYISEPKGYEMMSCYEGLCELYRATEDEKYLKSVINFAKQVIDKEIMIVGSGSSSELWCDGKKRQSELIEHPLETCVTVTWIKLCYNLLRLTGDSIWADQMEISLYNALLSALVPDGSWWAYYSPLTGSRKKSHIQIAYVKSSCCVVNGPRGLMKTHEWAVMLSENGPVINLYNKGSYNCHIKNQNISIVIDTEYPKKDDIRIKIICDNPLEFTLRLRIPDWSKNSAIYINEEKCNDVTEGYFDITRVFNDKDDIIVQLDMRGRIITSPGSVNYKSVMCGPIVLALDNRLVEKTFERLWIDDNNFRYRHADNWKIDYFLLNCVSDEGSVKYIDLEPDLDIPDDVWMAYKVPFISRPTHFFNHTKKVIKFCDYASAGNVFSNDNNYKVWLPQPMSISNFFIENTDWDKIQNL